MARIIGMGNYCEAVTADVPDLKPLLKETLGQSVRRIDRFIQLALIGAASCVNSAQANGAELPTDTAVYLASGRGDMEITVEVQRDLFENAHAPKPLNFINTVSNAASFYIAQNLKLSGRNQFIASRHWAFEVALQAALLDLALGKTRSALVGVVDVIVPPLADHRQRLELDPATALAEGSHWLWLDNHSLAASSLGTIESVRTFIDKDELNTWVRSIRSEHIDLFCSGGQFIGVENFLTLRRDNELAQELIYRNRDLGYYDSQSGGVIAEFIQADNRDATLLHINSDPLGRYIAVLARRESHPR